MADSKPPEDTGPERVQLLRQNAEISRDLDLDEEVTPVIRREAIESAAPTEPGETIEERVAMLEARQAVIGAITDALREQVAENSRAIEELKTAAEVRWKDAAKKKKA